MKIKKFLPFILFCLGTLLIGIILGQLFSPFKKAPVQPDQSINQKIGGARTESLPQNYQENITDQPNDSQPAVKVTKVVDGDTIEIETGQRVRYIGIDTPETVHPQKPVECFGREASSKNKELVEGKVISLEKDVSETDKYGRLLRYVYVDGVFVNQNLVQEGYAYSSSYPPDIKYQDQLTKAEREARENNRGLWGACQNQSPSAASDCPIKGNISSSGEKIYHMPGQKYYDKTVINESRGERWFCSEEEAQAAGWRKSKV